MQEKMIQIITKWSLKVIAKHLVGKQLTLYNLEETVFKVFLPIQQKVLEQASKEIEIEHPHKHKKCPHCQCHLHSKGKRKKSLTSRYDS